MTILTASHLIITITSLLCLPSTTHTYCTEALLCSSVWIHPGGPAWNVPGEGLGHAGGTWRLADWQDQDLPQGDSC